MAIDDGEALRNLVASYSLEADARNVRAWANLFAADGVLILQDHVQARGPDALHDWFAGRSMPEAYHMVANLRLEIDGDSAAGTANFVAVGADRLIGARGRYAAEFGKIDGSWRIRTWRIEVA